MLEVRAGSAPDLLACMVLFWVRLGAPIRVAAWLTVTCVSGSTIAAEADTEVAMVEVICVRGALQD